MEELSITVDSLPHKPHTPGNKDQSNIFIISKHSSHTTYYTPPTLTPTPAMENKLALAFSLNTQMYHIIHSYHSLRWSLLHIIEFQWWTDVFWRSLYSHWRRYYSNKYTIYVLLALILIFHITSSIMLKISTVSIHCIVCHNF